MHRKSIVFDAFGQGYETSYNDVKNFKLNTDSTNNHMGIFHSTADEITRVLDGKNRFVVPDYQRAYSWDDARVEELWNDLMDNSANPDRLYLLGPVVTVKKPSEDSSLSEIVDGQQRLVTLTLLFCALRDSLAKHEPEGADKVDYDDLIKEINKSIKADNGQPLIKLNNSNDDSVFTSICIGEGTLQQNPKSNTQIISNYQTLLDHTNRLCNDHFEKGNPRDAIRNISKLLNTIKLNVYFIYIVIEEEDYSYQVFQSLNSKGQKLNQSDLIKSLLLNIVQKDDDRDRVKDLWNKIMSSGTIKKNPDDFLYYSMLSRTCPKSQDGVDEVLKKNLYSAVKKHRKDRADVDAYLQNLLGDSRIIETLNRPSVLISENDCDPDFVHLFYGIQQINAKYFRRPIIAAYRAWGLSDKTKSLVDCLLKFFFMYRTISKHDIDQIKRIAKDATCQILDGRSLDEILYTVLKSERLGSAVDRVDQEAFMKEFKKNVSDLKGPVATYILYSLEKKLSATQGTSPSFSRYHVEHIFPNNPNDDWTNKEKLQDHRNRLGNLTLVDMRWNSSMQSRSFADKRDQGKRRYSNSDLELNKKHLIGYSQWGVKEIEDREERLIEHAKEIWDLSEYSRLAKKPQG